MDMKAAQKSERSYVQDMACTCTTAKQQTAPYMRPKDTHSGSCMDFGLDFSTWADKQHQQHVLHDEKMLIDVLAYVGSARLQLPDINVGRIVATGLQQMPIACSLHQQSLGCLLHTRPNI